MSAPAAEFPDIILSAGRSKKRGTVQLSGSGADAKLVFHSKVKPIEINLSEVQSTIWTEVGSQTSTPFVLKIGLRGKSFAKLTGFSQSAFNPLQSWLSAAGRDLVVEKLSLRGANYGTVKVDNHRIQFVDKEHLLMFDLPLSNVTQTVVAKSDVAIEFPQEDDIKSPAAQMETLCEIRIFVPNDEREKEIEAAVAEKAAAKAAKAEAVKVEGEEAPEEEDEEEEEDFETAAQLLAKDITQRAGVDDLAVQPIARFELMFQSPRGKYEVDLYTDFLKLHSKTFQYKILYKFIQHLYLLEVPREAKHYFVIALNPPVRQGATAYPYLLTSFDSQDLYEDSFNIDEQTCAEKYNNTIQPHMKGTQYDIVVRTFNALTQKKVNIPAGGFLSKAGGSCVRCSLKASDGYLFVMGVSFFFIKKPIVHIKYSMVNEVQFRRVANSATTGSKTFDLYIITNEEKNNEYIFSGIQRDEYQDLFDFLRRWKSKDGSRMSVSTDASSASLSMSAAGRLRATQNYDEELDPGMARVKEEAGSDSEDDEDFEGGDTSESSESDSDMPAEASDSEEEAPVKRKKKSRHDSEDDDEEGGASKKGTKRKRGEREDKPKRRQMGKSAYMLYLDEARPAFVAEHPELKSNMIEVTKRLAAQWKELDAEGRAKYEDLSQASKAAAAAAAGDEEDVPRKKKGERKAPRKSKGPQRPPSAKALWEEQKGKPDLKAAEPSLTPAEIKSKLNEQWKAMTEEEKQPFVEQNLPLARKFKEEMAQWKKEHPEPAAGEEDDAADGGDDAREERSKKKKEKKSKKEKKNKKESPPFAPSEPPCYLKPSKPPVTNKWCSATAATPV